MLKIFTCTEKSGVGKACSGHGPLVKRLHSSAACFILRKKGIMPLTGVVLPYLLFECCRMCNCTKHTEND